MADKMRSTNVPLSFAPLGLFSFAFNCCLQAGALPQTPEKRRFGGFFLQLQEHPIHQMFVAETHEAKAEVVTKALCQPSEFITTKEALCGVSVRLTEA